MFESTHSGRSQGVGMKAILTTVILTLAAVGGAGWATDLTVRDAVGQLAGRVGLGGMIGSPAAPLAPDTSALVAAAEALDQQFIAAVSAGNAEALAALYWNSPDVASYPPDAMSAVGPDAIKTATGKMVEMMSGATLELVESHHIVIGDAVIGHGTWKMTAPGPDGQPVETLGRYTDVKAERDGKWVYLVDHASVPMPPPPAEPETK